MNIAIWVLQILLAFHTFTGAIWKFSNSAADTMPSLAAIPPSAWLALSVFEIACAIALILPVFKKFRGRKLESLAAAGIALEMFLFCGLHFAAGDANYGPVYYWLAVVLMCGLVIIGRRKKPLA